MKFFLAFIAVACFTPVITQRQAAQYCVTPENYYGSCVTLSRCPQVVNVFQTANRRVAQEYVFALQRSCGTRNIGGDPVICCTRPLPPQQQPVTAAPNPFFPTQPTTNRNPFLPTVAPPPVVTTIPAPITTTTSTAPPPPSTSAALIDNRATTCRGPDTREGSCIELKNCQELVTELYARQSDPSFANFLRASNTICGGTNTFVCCPSNVATVTEGPVRIRNTGEIPRRLPTVEEGCGYTSNAYKKIVGGEVSKKGAWPWITLLGYDDTSNGSPFKCGGTLITARHVVTAAHCIRRDLTFVRLGEHDLSIDTEARHVDIKIVKQVAHPDYNKRNGRSDIALLYLERNVDFTDFISPICLPSTPELRQKSYVRYTPFVVGWGKTMEGGTSANVLQELQIPIYENNVCQDRYKRKNLFLSADQFDSAVICAGVLSGGKDTCQGDSGGPLMIPEMYKTSARYYLIGIVSYGIGCARPEVPGVYTSTQFFMDWIIQNVANTP